MWRLHAWQLGWTLVVAAILTPLVGHWICVLLLLWVLLLLCCEVFAVLESEKQAAIAKKPEPKPDPNLEAAYAQIHEDRRRHRQEVNELLFQLRALRLREHAQPPAKHSSLSLKGESCHF
jgi:hypothetical protein